MKEDVLMRVRASKTENEFVMSYTPEELLRLAQSQKAENRIEAASYGGKEVLTLLVNDSDTLVKEAALRALFTSLPKEFEVVSCSTSEIQGEEKEAIYCEIAQKGEETKIGFWVDTFSNDRVAVYNDEAFLDKDGNFTNKPIPELVIQAVTQSLQTSGAEICHIITAAERQKTEQLGNEAITDGKRKYEVPER